MTQTQPVITAEKFQNAEQLWFWFLHSRAMRSNNFIRPRVTPTRRPCEILDLFLPQRYNLKKPMSIP